MKKLILLSFLFPLCLPAQVIQFGHTTMAADSLVRPDSAAVAYTAGDALNDSTTSPRKVLVFENLARVTGGSGYIVSAYMFTDTSNTQAVTLHLYADSTGIPRTGDNAAITFSYAQGVVFNDTLSRKIGTIAFSSAATVAQNYGESIKSDLMVPFKTQQDRKDIYGIVEVTGTPTPKRLGKYKFVLVARSN